MKGLCIVDVTWCIGEIYRHIAPYVGGEVLNWDVTIDGSLDSYDWVLTTAGEGTRRLIEYYKTPRHKIYAVSHSEYDSLRFLRYEGNENIGKYAGYAVVSDTLACSSLSMGIIRIPTVLRGGVDCALYDAPVPQELRIVGYGASYRRLNEFGVEQKRGDLVKLAVDRAGLLFKPAISLPEALGPLWRSASTPKEKMPEYYRTVDAVIMSSLQEGGGMPPLEAAAAGRLVIGTPVGEFPRLAYEGLGILAPLNADAFVDFVVDQLNFYKYHLEEFNNRCVAGREAARKRDWSCVAQDWVKFVRQ